MAAAMAVDVGLAWFIHEHPTSLPNLWAAGQRAMHIDLPESNLRSEDPRRVTYFR